MVWLCPGGIALLDRPGNPFANWAIPTTVRVLPSQAILLAGGAYDSLGVLVDVEAFTRLERIRVLRFYVTSADINRVQFVSADAAMEELDRKSVV